MKKVTGVSDKLLMNENQTAEESTTVTEESMALIELAEQHAGNDFLRELGQFALQRLMELEGILSSVVDEGRIASAVIP